MSQKKQRNSSLAGLRRPANSLAFVILTAAIFLFLFGSSLWAMLPPPVSETGLAQLAPTVRIEPVQSTVAVGDTFTVTVMIDDAVDLGAFQVGLPGSPGLVYDPAIVWVDGVSLGDFLGSTGRQVIIPPNSPHIDNEAGEVAFAAFSYSSEDPPQPGPNGSGALALVRLRAVGQGSSPLDLQNVILTDTQPNSQTPSVEDGTVTVSTVSSGITGQAYLQGRDDHSGVTITVSDTGQQGASATDGSYAVTDVLSGTYVVTATMPCYLYTRRENVTVVEGTLTTLPDVTLLAGDANGDGVIDIFDLVIVGRDFTESVPPGDPRADINGDDIVDIFDLVLIGRNFTKTAPGSWP